MATPKISENLKGDEDARIGRPISEMNDGSSKKNEIVSKDASEEIPSNTKARRSIKRMDIDPAPKEVVDPTEDVVADDGGVVDPGTEFHDGRDNEVQPRRVKLYSCNQQPANKGRFLKMEVDNEKLTVTTTGISSDPYALWVTHFTVDEKLHQVVIFENWKCSELTKKRCVLYTHQVAETQDYVLVGKKIDVIPKTLNEIEPTLGFLKRPKAPGSELLFLKSMLTTKEKPLIVGFDGAGQPIPMNRVKKYTSDFQAFFKIIEAG